MLEYYLSLFLPTRSGPNSNVSDVKMYFLWTISSCFLLFLRWGKTILKHLKLQNTWMQQILHLLLIFFTESTILHGILFLNVKVKSSCPIYTLVPCLLLGRHIFLCSRAGTVFWFPQFQSLMSDQTGQVPQTGTEASVWSLHLQEWSSGILSTWKQQ